MVNPLMGAKMEPLSGLEGHHHHSGGGGSVAGAGSAGSGSVNSGGPAGGSAAHHLGFVKLELDPHHHLHAEKEDEGGGGGGKVEVKMEVLGELFGYGFGCDTSSLLSEVESSRLLLTGDGPAGLSFSMAAVSPDHNDDNNSGGGLIRTVKLPPAQIVHHHHHSSEDDDGGGFPPVLSIPASFAASLGSPVGGLQISISPISQQGADTTTSSLSLASPTTPVSAASSSSSSQKKTVYTAKGNGRKVIICQKIRDRNKNSPNNCEAGGIGDLS